MLRRLSFAVLGLLLLTGTEKALAQVNVTGTWEISWENPRGASTSTFTFEQDGTSLSGVAVMAMGGPPGGGGGGGGTREVEITDGKVEGNKISFSMAMGRSDRPMSFTFTGTVTGDTMEGTMTTPRGENPFTGKRK